VLKLLPSIRQNLLFSATFSDEIRQLASGFLNNPAAVDVARRNATAEAVAQVVHPVDASRKRELLAHLIKTGDWRQVLVFTRTKHGANRLAQQLEREGIEADAIHGNKSQNARTRALARFKANELQVLVATDIAARGLDIEELPHVVNYDIPNVSEDYVHRIGRTGRAGSTGEAVSLVSHDERGFMRDIERLIKREIEQRIIPGFEPSANPPPAPEDDRGPRPERRQGGGRNDNASRGGARNAGRSGRGGRGGRDPQSSSQDSNQGRNQDRNQDRPSRQTSAALPAAPEVDGNRLEGSPRPRANQDIDDNIGNRIPGHGPAESTMRNDNGPRNGRGRRGRRGGRRPGDADAVGVNDAQPGVQAGADNFADMENPPASFIEPGNRAPRVRTPDDIPDDIGNRAIDYKEPEIDDDIGNRIGYVPKNVDRFAQPGQQRRNGPRNSPRNQRAGQRGNAAMPRANSDIDGNRQRGPRRDGPAGGAARGPGRGPGGGQGRGPGRGTGRGPGRGNVGNEERGGRPAPIIGGSGLQAQQLRQPGDNNPSPESNQNRPPRNEGRPDRRPDRGGGNATAGSRQPGQRPPGQRQPGARNAQGQRRQPGAGGRNPGNRNPARYDEVQPASHESALHKTAMGDRQGDREPQRKGLFGKVASLFSGGPRRDKGSAR
jgi:superfamily II DNA/RNA helicase